jgi:hypothetical protein
MSVPFFWTSNGRPMPLAAFWDIRYRSARFHSFLNNKTAGRCQAVRIEISIDRAFISLFLSQNGRSWLASTRPGNPPVEGRFPVLGDTRSLSTRVSLVPGGSRRCMTLTVFVLITLRAEPRRYANTPQFLRILGRSSRIDCFFSVVVPICHTPMNASSASAHIEASLLPQKRVILERSTASFWRCPPCSYQRRAAMSKTLAQLYVFLPWTNIDLRYSWWRHAHVAESNRAAAPRSKNLIHQLALFASTVQVRFDRLEALSGCVPCRLLLLCLRRLWTTWSCCAMPAEPNGRQPSAECA